MKGKGATILIVTVVGLGLHIGGAAAARIADWKGAEVLTQTSLAPNPARCGDAPSNLEATFAGTGVDTAGGAFSVTVSGCLNLDTLRVFDLEATDTYVRSGDSVLIAPDDFTLIVDPATCVATNTRPVMFEVAGGTGEYEEARGGGQFDFAVNWAPCNGLTQPTHIWFRGTIES